MPEHHTDWFAGIEEVVAEPVKFKLQLAIGEDAYASLRVRKAVFEAWDVFGAASTAAALAKSSVVASTFFPASGLLAAVGLGTAATPVGWVIGAAVVAGGSWIGLTRYLRKQTDQRVRTVPEFINTPLDVLGLALFDLTAPLVLKVANADGHFDQGELKTIERWFIRDWGYDPEFVYRGLGFSMTHLDEVRIEDIAQALARFKKECPDCNYTAMTSELQRFLREVIEADGVIDAREEAAVEQIGRIFDEEGKTQVERTVRELGQKLGSSAETAGSAVAEGASRALHTAMSGASWIGSTAAEAVGDTFRSAKKGASRLGGLFSGEQSSSEPSADR